MAEIRHLENRHDVIFSAKAGPIWIKFCRLVQNDMSTAMIWSKSKPDVEFQYGGLLGEFNGMSSQSHLSHFGVLPPGEFNVVIPDLRVTLEGAATWRIPDPSATCHIAGCKNSIRHIENHYSPYFINFFVFLLQFELRQAMAFVSSPIHLFRNRSENQDRSKNAL